MYNPVPAIEFGCGPLAAQSNENILTDAMLAFEAEVLLCRPAFQFHALLTDGEGNYAHLVVADDPAAFAQVGADAEQLPSFRALLGQFDMERMTMRIHRPLGPRAVPEQLGVLEHGLFRLKDEQGVEPQALARRAAPRRQDSCRLHTNNGETRDGLETGRGF